MSIMAVEPSMSQQLFTIGHSTHPLEELVSMLRSNGVRLLVDVRTVPKSRTNPQVRLNNRLLVWDTQHVQ